VRKEAVVPVAVEVAPDQGLGGDVFVVFAAVADVDRFTGSAGQAPGITMSNDCRGQILVK
jgi:hypothetical protein